MTKGFLITFYLQLQYKSKTISAPIFCNISLDLWFWQSDSVWNSLGLIILGSMFGFTLFLLGKFFTQWIFLTCLSTFHFFKDIYWQWGHWYLDFIFIHSSKSLWALCELCSSPLVFPSSCLPVLFSSYPYVLFSSFALVLFSLVHLSSFPLVFMSSSSCPLFLLSLCPLPPVLLTSCLCALFLLSS